jgi:hypothetical protein
VKLIHIASVLKEEIPKALSLVCSKSSLQQKYMAVRTPSFSNYKTAF